MLVLGGSLHHPGGLEAFCQRAVAALNAPASPWRADWRTTDNAYLSPRILPRAILRLAQVARDARRYHVAWLQWSTFADLLFLLVLRARRVPVIVTPHLGANARLQRVPIVREAARWLLGRADRLALLFAAQEEEVALPRDTARQIARSFLPQAALTDENTRPRAGPLRLIHAGRMSEAKGSFRAIAVCAALQARGVPVTAMLVGRADAPTMAALHDAVERADLGESVEFVDWLDEPAMMQAYGRADVLVHLSLIDSYPLVVLEAMARGVVPVVGPMLGARSMVDQYGGYVAHEPMVENAATWLLEHSVDQLRDLGAEIATAVRADFAWSNCADRIIAIADAVRRKGTD